jgi:hypothetical protein
MMVILLLSASAGPTARMRVPNDGMRSADSDFWASV